MAKETTFRTGFSEPYRPWRAGWRTGGPDVEAAEREEREERANAIPIEHARIRETFRIDDTVAQSRYASENPLDLIAEITRLSPQDRERSYGWTILLGGSAGFDDSGPRPRQIKAKKAYKIVPHITGSQYKEPAPEGKDFNPHPMIGFAYYARALCNKTTGYRNWWLARTMPFIGGIESPAPQFAAVIHDGHQEKEIRERGFAGLTNVHYEWERKEPVRLCLLGEIDESSDTMAIRRIILDGKKLELTRENLTLAVSYADNLAAQIHEGNDYDPSNALQRAYTSLGRVVQHSP
jgi:hypothetical protein